jgi:tetratricopeptide (TPR) repeat protein
VRRVGCALLLLLAACSSAKDQPSGPPEDQTLTRHEQAGKIAYGLDRPDEAVAQFQAALKQAQARDDLKAIGDLSFNLAVAQLRANRPQDALATTRQARAELIRRGSQPFPSLILAEATALYRIGKRDDADALAAQIEASGDADAAAGASFVRGLIADEADNEDELRDALKRLSGMSAPLRLADRQELQARLALRQGDLAGARAAAMQAAGIRQEAFDYRGMARALAVAALAAERAGEREPAADLYLRAGRSAAAQSDVDTARPWLERALSLTKDSDTKQAAKSALASLQ